MVAATTAFKEKKNLSCLLPKKFVWHSDLSHCNLSGDFLLCNVKSVMCQCSRPDVVHTLSRAEAELLSSESNLASAANCGPRTCPLCSRSM